MSTILNGLTPTERDILESMAVGLTNREIAARRFCSEQVVKAHVSAIYTKLRTRNRVEAAVAYVLATQDAPAPVTRIVHRPIQPIGLPCPACAIRRLAVTARNLGLHVVAVSDRGIRVATARVPSGILLHDEQDLNDLRAELVAEAA